METQRQRQQSSPKLSPLRPRPPRTRRQDTSEHDHENYNKIDDNDDLEGTSEHDFKHDNHEHDFENDEDDDDGENHLGLLYLGTLLANGVAPFATE